MPVKKKKAKASKKSATAVLPRSVLDMMLHDEWYRLVAMGQEHTPAAKRVRAVIYALKEGRLIRVR